MGTARFFSFYCLVILSPLFSFSHATWAGPAQPLELAVILPQSGKAEAYGKAALPGAEIAVAEINHEGGILGRPLALIVLDNKSSALHAKQMAEKAIQRKVIGVVGDLWSTHSLAIAPLLQNAGVPMISPLSTAPEVTRVGNYIFRSCYTDDFQGKLMAEFAFQDCGLRRAAVLTNISETYSQILADYFAAAFAQSGGQVVFRGGYKGSAVDFKELLTTVKEVSPEVVFVPGYSRDSGLLIKQARAMGISAVFMGGDAWETTVLDYAGPALSLSYFSTHWHPGLPYPRSKAFIQAFKARYGDVEISPFAPLTYDAVRLLADAIKRADSTDRAKVRNALAETKDYAGTTGRFSFDGAGNPSQKSASILRFQDGTWQFFKAYEPK